MAKFSLRSAVAAVALAVLAMSAASAPGLAQKLPAPVIAVVDYDRVLRESKAGQSVATQIQQQYKTFQADIHPVQRELEKTESELEQQKSTLSPEAYAQREREHRENTGRYMRAVQGMQRVIDRMNEQGTQEILDRAGEILQEIVQKRGINLLIDVSQRQRQRGGIVSYENMVLYADDSLNVTGAVLAELDRRLPTVKLAISGETSQGEVPAAAPVEPPPQAPRLQMQAPTGR